MPLRGEAGRSASSTVFTPLADAPFGEAELEALEELASRAGPAIENARRFREARQLADLDALTGLHNRRYFHETLAREVSRAQRYDRRLALIVFDLDDFKAINDRIGHLAGDAVLAEAAERVRGVVRSADVACRVGGDEFAIILPESALADADQLYRAARAAVSARPDRQAGRVLRLGRRRRAAAGRRPDGVLRARRRGAVPRQGAGKGQVARSGLTAAEDVDRARPQGAGRTDHVLPRARDGDCAQPVRRAITSPS